MTPCTISPSRRAAAKARDYVRKVGAWEVLHANAHLLAKLVRHHAAFLTRCSIGFTDSRSPAAPRMAVRLRSSGFPDFESIR